MIESWASQHLHDVGCTSGEGGRLIRQGKRGGRGSHAQPRVQDVLEILVCSLSEGLDMEEMWVKMLINCKVPGKM
jgi:hypothetical protein